MDAEAAASGTEAVDREAVATVARLCGARARSHCDKQQTHGSCRSTVRCRTGTHTGTAKYIDLKEM
jgi:class 3 adenylate cyclase